MEIKVKCQCGSVYAFQDNLVDGRIEFPVSCSNCGADGTEKANAYIAAKLSGAPDPTEEKPKKSLLGFFKKKDRDLDESVAAPAPKVESNDSVSESGDETSILRLGIAAGGALAVGALGALGWFYLTKATGYEFGFVAWALGGAVGIASRILAPRGHHFLGVTAALAAVVAIGGGEFLVGKWLVKELVSISAPATSEMALSYAKRAAEAKTDEEIREAAAEYNLAITMVPEQPGALATYQSYQASEMGILFPGATLVEGRRSVTFAEQEKAADPEELTPKQVEHFTTKVLPELKAFAAGKPTQKEYEAGMASLIVSRLSIQDIYIFAMTPYSIFWLFLGVCSAFKIARNAGARY